MSRFSSLNIQSSKQGQSNNDNRKALDLMSYTIPVNMMFRHVTVHAVHVSQSSCPSCVNQGLIICSSCEGESAGAFDRATPWLSLDGTLGNTFKPRPRSALTHNLKWFLSDSQFIDCQEGFPLKCAQTPSWYLETTNWGHLLNLYHTGLDENRQNLTQPKAQSVQSLSLELQESI